jgi:hypothetical protein
MARNSLILYVLRWRSVEVDNVPDILAAITPIVEALEELGIPYHIGGSVASSLYGLPRLTIDADLVADIRMEHVRPLVKQLETDYYIDEDMIRDAIRSQSSFNVIHLIWNAHSWMLDSKTSPLHFLQQHMNLKSGIFKNACHTFS